MTLLPRVGFREGILTGLHVALRIDPFEGLCYYYRGVKHMDWGRAGLMVVALSVCEAALFAEEQKPRVSVAPLGHSLTVLEEEAQVLSSLLETALVKSGAFTMIMQSEMRAILAAQEASLQDFADRESAVRIGKVLSASHLVVGTIARLGRAYVVNVQLVEVETGRAVKAEGAEALSPKAFSQMAVELAGHFAGEKQGTAPDAGAAPSPATQGIPGDGAREDPSYRVRMYVTIGDRFMALRRYDAALAQYEKARLLDEFNVDVLWRTVTAMKEKLLLDSLFRIDSAGSGLDVALRDDYRSFRLAAKADCEALLEKIYTIQAIDPLLEDDVTLLLDEAQVFKMDANLEDAKRVLRRAYRLAPDNAFVLGELGLLDAFDAPQTDAALQGIELIRRAVAASPQTPLFHLYLGRSLERREGVLSAAALRAYRQAAALAGSDEFWTARIRLFAEQSMQRMYYQIGARPGGVLTDELALPVEERLEHMEYMVSHGVVFSARTPTRNPDYFLAALSFAGGKPAQAEATARRNLPQDPAKWTSSHKPMLELFERILAQTGKDQALLSTVRKRLKELK